MRHKKNLKEDDAWESLDELEELVNTAGARAVKVLQRVDSINPGYYIGTGKVEELKELVALHGATGVVSDDELSPVQMRNLSLELGVKVMDRTLVILDIFAQRARSREGKLQVEIAQLKYQYSRLTGFGEVALLQGGGIGTRGPGEKKIRDTAYTEVVRFVVEVEMGSEESFVEWLINETNAEISIEKGDYVLIERPVRS